MAILAGPHDHLPDSQLSRAQAEISAGAKIAVDTCLTNRGSHAFLIQHAYQNVADFIARNSYTYLDRELILEYIRSGFRERADSGVVENPIKRTKRSATPRGDKKATSPADVSPGA